MIIKALDGRIIIEGDFVSPCAAIQAAIESKANLRWANLHGANLRGANLHGANLREADLYEANLYEAILTGANLREADLTEANLRGANLWGAYLRWANLSEANLYGANLWGANLHGANLYEAKLTGADLTGAILREADLRGANLTGANLRGADLHGAILREPRRFAQSHLDGSALTRVRVAHQYKALETVGADVALHRLARHRQSRGPEPLAQLVGVHEGPVDQFALRVEDARDGNFHTSAHRRQTSLAPGPVGSTSVWGMITPGQ